MVDHLACEIEAKNGSYDFETLFHFQLQENNWHTNLKSIEKSRLLQINKTIRRRYLNNVLKIRTNIQSILVLILFVLLYYSAYSFLAHKPFQIFSLVLYSLPVLVFTVHYFYITLKSKKSAYLLYGYFYICFSLLMLNGVYQFIRPNGLIDVSLDIQKTVVFLTTILNMLFIYSGIKVYLDVMKKFKIVYQKSH